MAVYSHSKLSAYEQCKYRYKLRYIDKVPSPVEKSIEAHLGTCVHDALEWLYKERLDGKEHSLDEVLEKYITKWVEDWTDTIVIVKQNLTAEIYKNKGIKFLIDYYTKHQPFKDGTIALEEKVWVNLGNGFPHKIIGYIDRLVYNEETQEYEIHDYKTANSLPNQEKFDKDRQLALYSLAIKEKYGQDKSVLLTWHYLNYNKQIFSRRTKEELEQLKQDIVNLIKEIESATEFEPTKSILCDWCEYKQYCKAWGNKLPEQYREKQSSLDMHNVGKNYPTVSKYLKK